MKDEIKEKFYSLEELKRTIDCYDGYSDNEEVYYFIGALRFAYDYITNLQEEKENQAHTIKTLLEENDNLRNTIKNDDYTIKKLIEGNKDVCGRNKKAIEYVKYELYILGIRNNRKQQDELLNILQGEDKE